MFWDGESMVEQLFTKADRKLGRLIRKAERGTFIGPVPIRRTFALRAIAANDSSGAIGKGRLCRRISSTDETNCWRASGPE